MSTEKEYPKNKQRAAGKNILHRAMATMMVRATAAVILQPARGSRIPAAAAFRIRNTSRPSPSCFCSAASSDVQQAVAPASPESAPAVESVSIHSLDIRVGRIVKAWKHPEADSLYVEEVDVGEEVGPRTICSGLVKFVPEEELQGLNVLVLANLKPRNMKGIKSNGMLLAASDAAHETVELLVPPEGSLPGERAWFGSEEDGSNQVPAATPNQLHKKKIWETLQPKLKTGDDRVVYYDSTKPMRTSAGLVKSKTLTQANVS